MRSRLTPIAVVMLCGVAAFAKTYRADRYDVQLQLDGSGSLEVVETVTFRFENGPFTFVYRDISARETDGISDVTAWMDGKPADANIQSGSPVKVRWNFPPLENETHTFVLKYRVAGVIRHQSDGQALIWRALPPDHKYKIAASDVTLNYPGNVRLLDAAVSGKRAGIFFGDHGVTAKMSGLSSEAKPVFRARFPRDSFTGGMPEWQSAAESRKVEFMSGMRTGVLCAVPLVALAILFLFRLRGSDGRPRIAETQVPVTQPPSGLPPAVAAQLAGSQYGSAGLLLDLARRGVIRISESEKRRFGARDFRIIREPGRQDLAPHEQTFLAILLPHGESEASMSKAGQRVASKWGAISKQVRAELNASGLMDLEGRRRSTRLSVLGIITVLSALALGGVAAALGRSYADGLMVIAAIGLFAIGVAAIIAGATVPIWTDQGAVAVSQWRRFRAYLKEVSRGRHQLLNTEALDRFLPYAAAFGVAQALVKFQSKSGGAVLPAWFGALDDGDISSFVAFMSVSDSSAASAAAGAGASGGGSSGAG